MSTIKDAITAVQEVMMLADKVERAGRSLSDIAYESRVHDRRQARLDAMLEIARVYAVPKRLPGNDKKPLCGAGPALRCLPPARIRPDRLRFRDWRRARHAEGIAARHAEFPSYGFAVGP